MKSPPPGLLYNNDICDHGHFRISRIVHVKILNHVKAVFAMVGMCILEISSVAVNSNDT